MFVFLPNPCTENANYLRDGALGGRAFLPRVIRVGIKTFCVGFVHGLPSSGETGKPSSPCHTRIQQKDTVNQETGPRDP